MNNQLANISRLEKDLWEAADNLRANSKLTSTEYCMPVLGVIFLRHAANRFDAVTQEIEASGLRRKPVKADYVKRRSLYLPDESRYEYLLSLPSDSDLGEAVNEAMDKIEESFEPLAGVLPKDYTIFERSVLEDLLRVFDSEAMKSASGDVFGRIYEYFLLKFAMQGAQDNGEFFTPPSLVQTIVNVIEPTRGVVLDPAVGSAGMFVQSSHFLERMGQDAAHNLTFYGQEKTATTIRLAKMNLAVHGLEGDIVESNTFYEDVHSLVGKCDYVMANPPFNVDMVDAEKVKGDVRLPFGLPGVNKKKKVSNGNYLWIQYFYSYLNDEGRSGFVMASSASDAGGDERTIRQKLIETGHVDVMIAIGTNFFYTRSLPCMLWFFDKGKPKDRLDRVLMIDARSIHRKITRVVNDFAPEQLSNIAAIVWLHRGEVDRYLQLINEYLMKANQTSIDLKDILSEFSHSMTELVKCLGAFNSSILSHSEYDSDAVEHFQREFIELQESWKTFQDECKAVCTAIDKHSKWIKSASANTNEEQQHAYNQFEPVSNAIRSLRKLADYVIKMASACHDVATKDLSATKSDSWRANEIRCVHKEVIRLPKDDEEDNVRVRLFEAFKQPTYFQRQIHWMQSRFPKACFTDVEGLCRSVTRAELDDNDLSLTPGRYVGVSSISADQTDDDFEDRMEEIRTQIADLTVQAEALAESIDSNLVEILR